MAMSSIDQKAMRNNANVLETVETASEVPIDETTSVPEVMEQHRERVTALSDEAKTELALRIAADYLDSDEFEAEIAAVEEEFPVTEETPETLEEIPAEMPMPEME